MKNQIFMIASSIVIMCIAVMKKIEPDNKFYKYYAIAILILYSIYLYSFWFQDVSLSYRISILGSIDESIIRNLVK